MVTARFASERGIALLATLLAIALMTIIVMDFTSYCELSYLSSANQANELRAGYLARSAVNIGVAVLAQDSRIKAQMREPIESLADVWAMPFPPIKAGGGTVNLSIVDAARKIDINELVDPRTGQVNNIVLARLTALFNFIGVSPGLLPAIIDWLDRDSVTSPGGAEADYYVQLMPPYAPRNGPMPTIGDLRLVRGMDDATFMKLRQFLTVMPEPRVNVNTAPPVVLASLLPQLAQNPRLVDEIVQARQVAPFTNVLQVLNLPGMGNMQQQLAQVLTTRSIYFTITAMGEFAGARKIIFASFRRNGNGTAALASWRED
jgi:general secretion pathway protein K